MFRETINDFDGSGVLQGQFNKDSSIISFAHSCFRYAISTKQDLWFATKDTISKQYDQTFKLIFEEIFNNEYKEFAELGISYFYTLIDDAVKSNQEARWIYLGARIMTATLCRIWSRPLSARL